MTFAALVGSGGGGLEGNAGSSFGGEPGAEFLDLAVLNDSTLSIDEADVGCENGSIVR